MIDINQVNATHREIGDAAGATGVVVAAALGQFYLFEGKTLRHLLINVGYIIIGLTALGAILGAFQAT